MNDNYTERKREEGTDSSGRPSRDRRDMHRAGSPQSRCWRPWVRADDPYLCKGLAVCLFCCLLGPRGVSLLTVKQLCILDRFLCWLCKGCSHYEQHWKQNRKLVWHPGRRGWPEPRQPEEWRGGDILQNMSEVWLSGLREWLDNEEWLPCFWLEWQSGSSSTVEKTAGRVNNTYIYIYIHFQSFRVWGTCRSR